MKVGEYIRTKSGIIAKVTYVDGLMLDTDNDVFDVGDTMMMEIPTEFIEEYVVKHSKNIIDLIEEGDYVNNHRIKDKWYDYGNECWHLVAEGNKHIFKENIKSILTKEQYEQNSYKIGE